jgi:hypothetical protein
MKIFITALTAVTLTSILFGCGGGGPGPIEPWSKEQTDSDRIRGDKFAADLVKKDNDKFLAGIHKDIEGSLPIKDTAFEKELDKLSAEIKDLRVHIDTQTKEGRMQALDKISELNQQLFGLSWRTTFWLTPERIENTLKDYIESKQFTCAHGRSDISWQPLPRSEVMSRDIAEAYVQHCSDEMAGMNAVEDVYNAYVQKDPKFKVMVRDSKKALRDQTVMTSVDGQAVAYQVAYTLSGPSEVGQYYNEQNIKYADVKAELRSVESLLLR